MSFWMWYYHIQWRLQASFKQSCWINSNMILLVGTWKLHYSKKMYGDCWRVIYLCTSKMGFHFDFTLHKRKIWGEVVEVKGILREERENKGRKCWKMRRCSAEFIKPQKDWGYLLHKLKIDYPTENRWNSGCLRPFMFAFPLQQSKFSWFFFFLVTWVSLS